jgi:histidyl-tRNA synthetase
MAPVWRAERPQKGRYREFYQCDVDTVGCASMVADAEVVTIAYQALRELGFSAFRILINNRKLLQAVMNQTDVPAILGPSVWRAVDKWDKIGPAGVRAELTGAGLSDELIGRLFDLLDVRGSAEDVLATLADRLAGDALGDAGIDELRQIIRYLSLSGVAERFYQIDLHMVRGLEYYTGPIFEIVVDEPKIGSLSGGGRYDNLIGLLGSQSYPAVGISLGLERLIDVIDELGMAPKGVRSTVSDVLVTVFDQERLPDSIGVAASLRAGGLNAEVYLGVEKLAIQLRYASRKSIPVVVILGPDELSRGEAVVRNMQTGQQQQVRQSALPEAIQAEINAADEPDA